MAADLALRDFPVRLWNRTAERIEAIQQRGGIDLAAPEAAQISGGTGSPDLVTDNVGEALDGADVVMVVVPATAHADIARRCAPHLRDGQIVMLNPGRTGGVLEFRRVLAEEDCGAEVTLAEAETFVFASRITGPAQARIFTVKGSVGVAALPVHKTGDVLERVRPAYPQFVPADNVLQTGLGNVAVMFHPAVMIVNAARIEAGHGDFEYYHEGITPSVAEYLETVDDERRAIADVLGIRVFPVHKWLYISYDAAGRNLYEAVHANPGYKGIMAPTSLQHRYLLEDVPTSLVPMVSIGEQYGVDMSLMRSLVTVACKLMGHDFWAEGRTVQTLGIDGLTVRQVRQLVLAGDPGPA
jgi:opine dehydrogenase